MTIGMDGALLLCPTGGAFAYYNKNNKKIQVHYTNASSGASPSILINANNGNTINRFRTLIFQADDSLAGAVSENSNVRYVYYPYIRVLPPRTSGFLLLMGII